MSLFGLVIVVAVLAFVAWPLFAGAGDAVGAGPRAERDATPWQREKIEAYSAIREAEFDYHMGKLSEADFRALREKYAARALAAIAAIEGAKTEAAGRADSRAAKRAPRCRNCDVRMPRGSRFCPRCGYSVGEKAGAAA